MPFYGRDWRSPGELWFKTADGHWIKTKDCRHRLIESLNDDFLHRFIRRSLNEGDKYSEDYQQLFNDSNVHQPHFFIRRDTTKEGGPMTTLTDVLSALNFKTALKDARRFNYVCKILKILIQDKMNLLSGRTQIFLMELLQEALKEVLKTGNFIGTVRELLDNLRESLKNYRYQHIGSDRMWKNHWELWEEMQKQIDEKSFNRITKEPPGRKFEELPPECLHRILSNLAAPNDLQMAGDTSVQLHNLVEDEQLWRKLILINFTHQQIKEVLPWRTKSIDDCNSKAIYRRLLRRYGDKHFYSSRIHLCENCRCLFWPIFGHPCQASSSVQKSTRDLTPEDLIKLFIV